MPPEIPPARPGFPSCRRTIGGARRALAAAAIAAAALALSVTGCTGKIGEPGGSGGGSTVLPPGLAGPINPGRVVAHRLNNVEYDNTVRDLVGVDLKPSSTYGFPDDAYVEGFDNNADALTAPPLLLEKLQTATEAIVGAALSADTASTAVRGQIMTCNPTAGESGCAT